MKRLVLLVAVLAFICLFTGTAFGNILNVPAEYSTIQDGIDAASTGDTVQVAAGIYLENIIMKSGVVIQGAGQGASIIDGGASGSVVTAIGVDSAANLDGFTITNGKTTANSGGGMYNENSSPTVTNCTFSANTALHGGGMYNYNSSPTVSNCTFSGNSASVFNVSRGGGMYNSYSSPTVTNCTFSENTTSASAGWGAGMSNEGSSPTVSKCSFFNNHSGIFGGGMSNSSNSSPIVTSCIFLGNWAQDSGGGIYNFSSSPTVTNCIFFKNQGTDGGGIYNYNSSPTLTNCTFSKNSFSMAAIENESNSSVTVTNCILWGDDSLLEIYNYDTSSCSVTYSDIDEGGGIYTGTGNINADPLFVDPDGPDDISGNEDDDYHLSAGSPCIDAGTSSGAPDTDLEGNPRPQGAGYDMGIYEFQLAKTTAMPGILLLFGD